MLFIYICLGFLEYLDESRLSTDSSRELRRFSIGHEKQDMERHSRSSGHRCEQQCGVHATEALHEAPVGVRVSLRSRGCRSAADNQSGRGWLEEERRERHRVRALSRQVTFFDFLPLSPDKKKRTNKSLPSTLSSRESRILCHKRSGVKSRGPVFSSLQGLLIPKTLSLQPDRVAHRWTATAITRATTRPAIRVDHPRITHHRPRGRRVRAAPRPLIKVR